MVQAVRCNVHQAGPTGVATAVASGQSAVERMRQAVEVVRRARERAEAVARV